MDISVIFATRNRSEILKRTLEAMSRLDTEGLACEIIVADNGSSDDTPELLGRFAQRLPLRVLTEPTPGKNRCLNLAVKMARGSFLVFTDDDVLPEPDWLQVYRRAAAAWPDDSLFGGYIGLDFPAQTPRWIHALPPMTRTFAFANYALDAPEGPVDQSPTGPNMAIRRGIFDEYSYNEGVGPAGKNYAMGSETELLRRLHAAGHRYIYVPSARVDHIVRPEQVELSWLAGRAHRLGRGQMAGVPVGAGRLKLLAKSAAQAAVTLPSYAWNLPRGEAQRFWSVWHLQKAVGRFSQYRIDRRASDQE